MTSQADRSLAARPTAWLERLDEAINAVVDYRALVPLRVAAGVLALAHLAPVLRASLSGTTYRDVFHIPPVVWFPELPELLYIALMWLAAAAAVATAAGLRTRVATIVLASGFGYHLFVTATHYHHNRAFLFVILVGLALMPVGDDLSIDVVRRRPAGRRGRGPQWPLLVLRFQLAAVYVASGTSKLLDPDWVGGVVLRLRVEGQAEAALARGVPAGLVELAASSGFQWWFSKLVIATELFIGIGLLARRTRWAAVWVAIAFHAAIELTADVELFSYVAIAALVIWVEPYRQLRTLAAPPHWLRIVRVLDWTGRFRLASAADWRLEDGDGGRWLGHDARWRTAALVPLTFFVAAPVVALRNLLVRWPARPDGSGPASRRHRAR